MAHEDMVKAWLKDAYSMEVAMVLVMENHAKDAKEYPDVQTRIQQHADETKQHAEMVKSCLERLGEKPSAVKTAIIGMTGTMQRISTGASKDELVKNALADYATENFEIASYTALRDAARELGDTETAHVCDQILKSEQSMAHWLQNQLPITVHKTLEEQMRQH